MYARPRITPGFRETHKGAPEGSGSLVISPVARPVEEGRVLITESVAQQPPSLMTVGGPGSLATSRRNPTIGS